VVAEAEGPTQRLRQGRGSHGTAERTTPPTLSAAALINPKACGLPFVLAHRHIRRVEGGCESLFS
jgi:hypothetical protein